ncbi:MAG: phospholipase [Renibacterium salmoninarum]|nr:phospholipase [Renibacterium salmoninarum]
MTSSNEPVLLWSKPESERAGTPLLVLLHGYGANEADLFGLAEQLPAEFTVVSVRAGHPAGSGYAWFPLAADLGADIDQVVEAAQRLDDWLESVASEFSSVSLLGFSLGMAMATTLLRHRPGRYAAVVGLSGVVVDAAGDQFFRDDELRQKTTPFFWGRDQADPVIPQPAIEYANDWLNQHTDLMKVLYTGMWHGICEAEIGHIVEFLRVKVLG